MRRIVEVLGLPPSTMLDAAPAASRDQFFEPAAGGQPWRLKDAPRSAAGGGAGGVPGAPGTRSLAVRNWGLWGSWCCFVGV